MRPRTTVCFVLILAFFGMGTDPIPFTRISPLLESSVVIQSESCSQSHVQAAINASSDGDVVRIPAGICTWTQGIHLNTPKEITIQGAGIDATTIIDNINKLNGGGHVFSINTQAGKRFRMTGMTFRGMAQDIHVNNHGTILIYGTSQDFRLNHLKFDESGTSAIRYGGAVYGLVDHCYFDLSNFKQGHVILHD